MAAGGDNSFIRYIYMGEVGERIPREATHIIVGEDVTVVLYQAFEGHPNIVEIICHENVIRIEPMAFRKCPSLRRVIMPAVKIIEEYAFNDCPALTDVEYGKPEIIKDMAFMDCESLKKINLTSARIVGWWAFNGCEALTDVKFGSELESIDKGAFANCPSLERITIPLKDNLFRSLYRRYEDDVFMGCENLMYADLVEGKLHEIIAALHLQEWKNEMNEHIDSINQILSNARAGDGWDDDAREYDIGEKAQAIRRWIRSVIEKIVHYKAQHRSVLSEAATAIQHQYALPNDILTNNVLPFLTLPSHTFEGESNRRGR